MSMTMVGCGEGTATRGTEAGRSDATQVQKDLKAGYAIWPTDSKPFGRTHSEWGNRWWQWAFASPVTNHPLIDADCSVGQSGPVWFLGGSFGGDAGTRHCTVPASKALFVTPMNVECSVIEGEGPAVEQLQECARADQDSVFALSVTIDGQPVPNPFDYRVGTGPGFAITLPENNVFGLWRLSVPAGTYAPLAQDGFYLMLSFSPGVHTLELSGKLPGFHNASKYVLHVQ
jgi:hypothetical protein